MKNQIPPFVHLAGWPYLAVNFTLGPREDLPSLPELLEGLLRHHTQADILVLRPLSRSEARLLRRTSEDAEVEAWAQMVVKEGDRLRARRG